MSYVSLIVDIVMAGLLVATIVYASVLNRKLATLRSSKQEMEALSGRLVESSQHAERALSDLKKAASESGDDLERRIAEAQGLVDDLRFLVDKGSGLADRLATDLDKSRGSAKKELASQKTPSSPSNRRAASAESETMKKNSATERRWDEDENIPEADAQLLNALRRVR